MLFQAFLHQLTNVVRVPRVDQRRLAHRHAPIGDDDQEVRGDADQDERHARHSYVCDRERHDQRVRDG